MSPSTRERDNARRRQDEWSARQAMAREASLARKRTALAVVAGVVGLALVVVLAVSLINGPRGAGTDAASAAQSAQEPPPAPEPPPAGEPSGCPEPPAVPAAQPPQDREAPDPSVSEGRTWTGTIATSCGDLGVELDGQAAPAAVASFVSLAREDFFVDTPCHRLTTEGIFVLQCGDPTGTGTGGPGYDFGPVENAPADDVYPVGTLAMARQGGNGESQGSQFFIVYQDSQIPSDAAGGYTVMGRVTSGMEIVDRIAGAGLGPDGVAPADPISLGAVTLQ